MIEVKPDSEETSHLLVRIKSGEREAFDGLFERHRGWLRRLVELRRNARLQARLDASDVVQETQLESFRRLEDYLERRPMPFRLWLRKTLQERMRMLERRHVEASRRSVARERALPEGSSAPGIAKLAGWDPTPSQQFARDEMAVRVREALARLDESDREILLIRTYEGLSYGEAGYILEIEPAAARKRHGRALLRLHKLLTARGVTESQI